MCGFACVCVYVCVCVCVLLESVYIAYLVEGREDAEDAFAGVFLQKSYGVFLLQKDTPYWECLALYGVSAICLSFHLRSAGVFLLLRIRLSCVK